MESPVSGEADHLKLLLHYLTVPPEKHRHTRPLFNRRFAVSPSPFSIAFRSQALTDLDTTLMSAPFSKRNLAVPNSQNLIAPCNGVFPALVTALMSAPLSIKN